MAKNKLIKFIPDKHVQGIFKDKLVAKSESEVIVSAEPSVIAQLLLSGIDVKEVSADGKTEKLITWDNLWEESTMPKAEPKVFYDNSAFIGMLVDYKMPLFKVSARCSNVEPTSVIIRKVTITGPSLTSVKVLVNGVETELDGTGSFTHTHTGNYSKSDILECQILKTFPSGTDLTITQTTTKDGTPLTGTNNTINGTISKGKVDFTGTELKVHDKTNIFLGIKQKALNVAGVLQTKATVTQADGTPVKGVKFDGILGIDGVTSEDGTAIIHELENHNTSIPEKLMKLPLGLKGGIKVALSALIKDSDSVLSITSPELGFEVKTTTALCVFKNNTTRPIIGAPINISLNYKIENGDKSPVSRIMRLKKGSQYVSNFSVVTNGKELVSDGVANLGTSPISIFETGVNESYAVNIFESGTYTLELISTVKGEELYSKSNAITFTVAQADIELSTIVPPEVTIGSTANVTLTAKVVDFIGKVNHKVAIKAGNKPYVGEVTLNGVRKETDSNGALVIASNSTNSEYSSKDGVTTKLDIIANTQGKWSVSQELSSFNGNATVSKTDTTKQFTVTLPAPDPVLESEVKTTDVKMVITKTLESDCEVMVTTAGTQTPVGNKSVSDNVTTVTGLQEETVYDVYVQRLQGKKSSVLKVKTDKTAIDLVPGKPIAPEPVALSEVTTTNVAITITKELPEGYRILAYLEGKTDVEKGTVSVKGNVTTISGLTQNTKYDLYVQRPVPESQGGGVLNSTKLTVTTKVTVAAPGPVVTGEVALTNNKITVTKTLESGCSVEVCTKGTTQAVGKKSIAGNVTSVTELAANTEYDIYVTRQAPDYQGGGTLRSTKLTVRTKVTVVAPGAVSTSEVQLTRESLTITKTVDADCTIAVYNAGTETEAGQKSVAGNVTTVTGLSANTQYDIFVTRQAPDYQGGGILKSPKLTVTTTAAPEPEVTGE